MKKSQFTESQIVSAIKKPEAGVINAIETQPIPNRFWENIAHVFGSEYFIGWKPSTDPHYPRVNPYFK